MFNSQIIAILAAILFPVFARAREKARQASCSSNVKEITLGFIMYRSDYDGLGMQRDISHIDPGDRRLAWMDHVQPYVKNKQIFLCPSMESPHSPWDTEVPTDYAYNFCRVRNTKEAGIHHPSEYGIFFDWPVSCIKDNPNGCSGCPLDHGWRESRTPPHNEGINVGYYDGHVKWHKAAWIQDRFRQRILPMYNQ